MSTPFRVISIDGGGKRGIYSAAYLTGLTQLFARETKQTGRLDIGKGLDLMLAQARTL